MTTAFKKSEDGGPARSQEIAVGFRGVSKHFGSTIALSDVSFEVRAATIHALVGQNGAGKSTALGVLAGRSPPSGGRVEIFGEAAKLSDPRRAHEAGIVAIYQELTIIPHLSAVENVFLGQILSYGGLVSAARMKARFRELCSLVGVSIAADDRARQLSVADQQILEIMRGVQSDARVLLFDEPTASLAPTERRALFRLMRDLRKAGHTMVFVSHNLDEVFELADDITVFRNGRMVASKPAAEWSKGTLVASMLGESMTDIYRRREASVPFGDDILRARNVSVPGAIRGVDISVRKGEIVGVAGLAGAGRTTLLRALAGAEPKATGSLWFDGATRAWPRQPNEARRLGIALVPEERKTDGLVLGMSSSDNIALPRLNGCSTLGVLSDAKLKEATRAAAITFRLDPARLSEPVQNLSGGNQQKALLARWKYTPPTVLLVDEPTRGIDIGAKAEILDALRLFSDLGTGVVVVSSELEEIVSIADRVIVMAEGRKVEELVADRKEVSLGRILSAAFDVEDHHV
ncbi:sugar ABC transporter ATP-binding protein [Mesorhizobium sp. M0767]|uniref:sugar ABC transporter ATP-binding protein n=1 Tax=Mesorhizobium sp. M0767 TaxID=2956995 RepID=UPI00333C67CC